MQDNINPDGVVYRLLIFILSFLFLSFPKASTFKGKVIDALTKEPLPFVNVFIEGTSTGCSSDIVGEFTLVTAADVKTINAIFSYVGYKREIVLLNSEGLNIVGLVPDNELKELVVDASFNPAIPIIKKVIANRKENDPEKNFDFSYQTYNKMYMYANTEKADRSDTSIQKPLKFIEQQYLMLIETIEDNRHRKPGKDESTVLASRTSGLMSTMIPMIATELQSFSFYPNSIKIGDKYFVSPISGEGLSVYNFELVESYIENTDTIFSIRFLPKNSTNSKALEGSLQISSDNYVLKSVIAKPEVLTEMMSITINQLYDKKSGHWMPSQLNTSFSFENVSASGVTFEGRSYAYINNIDYFNKAPKEWGSPFEVEVNEDALDPEVLDSLRPIELTHMDSLTYHVIDSLGKANHLDKKFESVNSWVNGRIPVGKLDLDFSRGFNYSEYEGLRLGIGLYTNQKLFKRFATGGYFAYGFKDHKWKYGGSAKLLILPKYDVNLDVGYQNDIFITASTKVGPQNTLLNPDQYYRIYTNRYNGGQKWIGKLSFRYKDLTANINGTIQSLETKFNYEYVLQKNDNSTVSINQYYLQTIGAEFTYQPKTRLMFDGLRVVSLGSLWPVLSLKIDQTVGSSTIGYTRLLGKITGKFRVPHIGVTNFSLHGGWVNQNTPLPFLFYQKSTGQNWAVSVFESFETAPIYNYLSSQFCNFFIDHNFGKFLDKGMLQPEFVMYSGLGWGNKVNHSNHLNTSYSTFEKGYFESGIKLINVIKSGFSGIGVGGFYRYGYYASSNPRDNFVAKVTLNIGL